MAFGLGFNKAKVLSAAEKFVAQGKIPAAIEEYRKIIEHDQKDLTILNTFADLCVRAGNSEEALTRFRELAEKCVEAGLIARAIAVYKRIIKLDPESLEPLLRIAELYSMQGLLRDARVNYLSAVESCIRRDDKLKAREIFEKVLMLDMENPQLQTHMAQLYAETGKKDEAVGLYLAAAERYLDRNTPGEAVAALKKLSDLDPNNADAKMLLGRAQFDQGELTEAINTLEGTPSLSGQKSALNLLFHAYRKLGNTGKEKEIANELFDSHGDFAGLELLSESLIAQGEIASALAIYEAAFDRLVEQRAMSVILQGLRNILASDPACIEALQLMLKLHRATGNVGETRETTELLAHAYVSRGELGKARDIYKELVTIEPDNPDHLKLLRQVEEQLGETFTDFDSASEPAPAMASDLGEEPAQQEVTRAESLSPREEQLVKNCITEAELYITYHQIGRAIETVESGLAELPGNIRLSEQLLSLCEQSKDYERAAACCEVLADAYVKAGDEERASRYAEMIANYRSKKQESSEPSAAAVEEIEPSSITAANFESSASDTLLSQQEQTEDISQVREIDLSMEWASLAADEDTSPTATSDDSSVEEIEFYIQAGLTADARAALERFKLESPLNPAIAGFEERLGTNGTEPARVEEFVSAAQNHDESPSLVDELLRSAGSDPEPISFLPAAETPEEPVFIVPEPQPDELAPAAFASEPQAMMEVDVATSYSEPALKLESAPTPFDAAAPFELSLEDAQPKPQAASAPQVQGHNPTAEDIFASLAADLENSLSPSSGAPGAVPVLHSDEFVATPANPMDEVFAEFKAGMEEASRPEDMETHYNMGVAFKEMALYDGAIGEFQKTYQLAEKSKDYSHLVQCCTLLATCFLEKAMPQLAVKWYKTALESPAVDTETVLALLYEIGSAYELAGDRDSALQSFLEVYARNIDYRDVANRIHSLQQPQ